MRLSVFLCYSVRFCGIRTPLRPSLNDLKLLHADNMASSVTTVFKHRQQNFLRRVGEGEVLSLSSASAHMPPKEPGLPMTAWLLERWLSGTIILRLSSIGFNFMTELFITSKR